MHSRHWVVAMCPWRYVAVLVHKLYVMKPFGKKETVITSLIQQYKMTFLRNLGHQHLFVGYCIAACIVRGYIEVCWYSADLIILTVLQVNRLESCFPSYFECPLVHFLLQHQSVMELIVPNVSVFLSRRFFSYFLFACAHSMWLLECVMQLMVLNMF